MDKTVKYKANSKHFHLGLLNVSRINSSGVRLDTSTLGYERRKPNHSDCPRFNYLRYLEITYYLIYVVPVVDSSITLLNNICTLNGKCRILVLPPHVDQVEQRTGLGDKPSTPPQLHSLESFSFLSQQKK